MKRDGGRLHHDIVRNLTRYTAWEGVMRLRCSKGNRSDRSLLDVT